MPLKIAITGSSGLIGSVVQDYFAKKGHQITLIIRPRTPIKFNRRVIHWDIDKKEIDVRGLEGQDAVVHLSGVNLAEKRWSKEFKEEIKESRLQSTRFLAGSLARLSKPPKIFLSASAIGFYGSLKHNDEINEMSPKGDSFLSEVCELWEKSTEPVKNVVPRTVHMRFGMVLARGGALSKMLPIFKLGLGGKIADGRQMMSWVSINEIPLIMEYLLSSPGISGAVNFVSPNPVLNAEFTKALGDVLHRPALLPVPRFAVRAMFGQMADELLLANARVMPRKLLEAGYKFSYPDLKSALELILNKKTHHT